MKDGFSFWVMNGTFPDTGPVRELTGANRLRLTFVCEMVDLTTRTSIATLVIAVQSPGRVTILQRFDENG